MAIHNATMWISDVKLPNGQVYEIHDKYAIHDPSDLGIHGALIFKGVIANASALPTAAASNLGHVYLISGDGAEKGVEYVCVENSSTTPVSYTWEKLGNIHDAASSTHKHAVTVTGSVGTTTVTGTVTVPTVNATETTVTGTAAAQTLTPVTNSVLGASTTFTTNITGKGLGTVTKKGLKATTTATTGAAVASNGNVTVLLGYNNTPAASFVNNVTNTTTSVINTVTPTTRNALISVSNTTNTFLTGVTSNSSNFLTGLGTASTVNAITNLTTTTPTAVSIANVTSVGTPSSWGFAVTGHVLEITGANGTVPTTSTVTVSRIGSNGNTKVYTGNNTTAVITGYTAPTSAAALTSISNTSASAVVSVSATNASFVNTVTSSSCDVINAISFTGANAITGLGTANTKSIWGSAKISTQPTYTTTISVVDAGTGDTDVVTDVANASLTATTTAGTNNKVNAITSVTASASNVTLSETVVTQVDVGSTTVNLVNGKTGTPTWTQKTGFTDVPVDNV